MRKSMQECHELGQHALNPKRGCPDCRTRFTYGRDPATYTGDVQTVAKQLVAEQPAGRMQYGGARVIAHSFAVSFPSNAPERGFWNTVKDEITNLQCNHGTN